MSVIIPLYNAEKYIAECLDSILAQTFQNFEVIVVDDCSTDNSAAVVESYTEKFGGRLTLARTQKNSGTPGEPGNIGIALSRGKYLLVLDNDDTITPTALEELYSVAKEFDADVVACEKYYSVPQRFWNDAEFRKQLKPTGYAQGTPADKPTLLSDNLFERVTECANHKFLWPLWSKLIRRDFLINNHIHFASNIVQDMLATYCLVYFAKIFVRVPNVINYYRVLEESVSHTSSNDWAKYFQKYFHALTDGFEYLDKILSGREFFQQRPDMKYLAFDTLMQNILYYITKIYTQIPAPDLEELLRKELGGGDNAALTAFTFSAMNIYRLQLIQAQQRITALENELRHVK